MRDINIPENSSKKFLTIDEGRVREIEIKNIDSSINEEEFLFEMNKTYEEFIKKDPSGYLWMHRRFKSGQAESLYPKWTSREKRREKRRMNRNKD